MTAPKTEKTFEEIAEDIVYRGERQLVAGRAQVVREIAEAIRAERQAREFPSEEEISAKEPEWGIEGFAFASGARWAIKRMGG